MSFIENFRAISTNKIPNNAILKPSLPAFERSVTSPETKEKWREAESAHDLNDKWKIIEKYRESTRAAMNGSLYDLRLNDTTDNLLWNRKDITANRDGLLKVLEDIESQNTWSDMAKTVRNAHQNFPNSDGINQWFDLVGRNINEMRRQAEESNGTQQIDPSIFIQDIRNRLKNVPRKGATLS